MTNQKQRLICVPCQSVLKNFAKVTEKHLCLSQKFQVYILQFYLKRDWQKYFPVKLEIWFRTPILQNTSNCFHLTNKIALGNYFLLDTLHSKCFPLSYAPLTLVQIVFRVVIVQVCNLNLSLQVAVVRRNGKFQDEGHKKKQSKFFEKRTFLTPWYAHVRVRIRG